MRRIVTIVFGIILIAIGVFIAMNFAGRKKKQRPAEKKVVQTVFIDTVRNSDIPITIIESGRLISKNRIELFAEVQGVMEPTRKEFKPGAVYKKGETMVNIRSDDFYANLQAQKSSLVNLITSILPDLRLDFPEVYQKWDDYVRKFDMDRSVPPLPKTTSEKEKFFITGRNIYTTYYNTINSEIIYQKYILRAPFDGILVAAQVTPGTLVRPGQKLGEYIDPTVYELEVAVSKTLLPSLSVGKKVIVREVESLNREWEGSIIRINGKVDQTTQTVRVYIELHGEYLREGLYLEALMSGEEKENAYEINRSLLVDETKLFIAVDTVLKLVEIQPLYFTERTVIVRGFSDGDLAVVSVVPGAHDGMRINIQQRK